MREEIEFLRTIVRRLIHDMEFFPDNKERQATLFEQWVKELNNTTSVLGRIGDHVFYAIPKFGFSPLLYSSSRETINDQGYRALKSYLNEIKPLLDIPVAIRYTSMLGQRC